MDTFFITPLKKANIMLNALKVVSLLIRISFAYSLQTPSFSSSYVFYHTTKKANITICSKTRKTQKALCFFVKATPIKQVRLAPACLQQSEKHSAFLQKHSDKTTNLPGSCFHIFHQTRK
jgi:hypothetical protein